MRIYEYQVKTTRGTYERGTVEGESVAVVQKELQAKGYFVVRIRETKPTAAAAQALDIAERQVIAPILYPVDSKQLAIFFSSIKVMLSAGMGVVQLANTLAEQTHHPTLKRAALDFEQAALAGKPMSSVMAKYPAAFSSAAIAVMKAGEHSGSLEGTAARLTEYYDQQFELEQAYRWQTFYPKILLIAFLTIPTVPTLVLGGFTAWWQMLLGRILPVGLAIVGGWYGYRALQRFKEVREFCDAIKLYLPWFGSLARRGATAKWARALAMLLRAGVPVHEALVAAAAASGNAEVQRNMLLAAQGVQEGKTLAEVLAPLREIPRIAKDMIATAETAGSVEETLDKVAMYYESETQVRGKQTAMGCGWILFAILAFLIGAYVISQWQQIAGGISSYIDSTP